jgi:hypothetical protein
MRGYAGLGFLKPFSKCPQSNQPRAQEEQGWGDRDGCTAAAEAVAAEVGAVGYLEGLGGVIVGDKIVYQRH